MQHINIFTKTRWLVTIILLTILSVGNVWGKAGDALKTMASSAFSSSYARKTPTGHIGFGQTDYLGANNATNHGKYVPTKADLPVVKAVNTSATTTTTGLYYWYSTTSNTNVGSIEFSYSAVSKANNTTAIAYVVYSSTAASDGSDNWQKVTLSSSSTSAQGASVASSGTYTFTFAATQTSAKYYGIVIQTSGYVRMKDATLTIKEGSTASCTAIPEIGTASLNGSFTLTSTTGAVTVSTSDCNKGDNCAWTDYGFVWGTSSTPTVDNSNKVQIGTSGSVTSWATDNTHKVQPSSGTTPTTWSTGVTYYVRAYGKNGNTSAGYRYGTVASFILRSITYNSNGGSSVTTQYVKSGGTYSAPTAPTKTGYTFGGWYTDNSTFNNAMNWSAAISANKTLYAKWTAKQTTVTLNNQSATTAGATGVTATYDAAVPSIASNLPARTGYTFGGYYTSTGGGGTQYIKADGTSAKNWDITDATKTLYAKWTANKYDITYKDQGGGDFSGTQSNAPTQHTYGSSTTLRIPTKTGYTFGGWFTTSACSAGSGVGNTTSASLGATAYTAAITLYAKWTKNSYTLTWNLNGGTVTEAGTGAAVDATGSPSSSVPFDDEITAPTVTKYGYNFSSWNNTPASTMPAANTTYTATWTAKSFTVTWMVNGTVYSAGGSTSVNFNGHVSTLPTDPDPKDYCGKKFMGWTTVEDVKQNDDTGLGLFTTAGTAPTVTVEGNVIYYAVFADYAD